MTTIAPNPDLAPEEQEEEKVTLGTKVALGRDHVINDMCEAIRHLSDKYQAGGRLLGVGIGVPGIRSISAVIAL